MKIVSTRFEARVDHHHLFLTPFGMSPRIHRGSWSVQKILLVGEDDSGFAIHTGCAMGLVWLTLRSSDRSPGPLADGLVGWEVGEEATVNISSGLTLISPMGNDPVVENAFVPHEPGLHRVRVLARGRARHYDQVSRDPSEEFEVTLWPVDANEPAARIGEEGL